MLKVQLLQGRVAQDFQQICGPIGTLGVIAKAPGVIKRGWWGYTAPMLSNVVQATAVTIALNIRKKKTPRLNELAKHRNQICKARHHWKFASLILLQLAPRSFCHAADGIWEQKPKFNFSRGELRKTSSRSAAPSAPLVSLSKHLEWSKGDCGDTRTAICCRSSCKWLLQVRPFATVYFTFLAFQRCQMLSKKQPWQWPLTLEKKTWRLNELAKHRNQVCKTRHPEKFASLRLLQLAPRSFCHAVDGIWERYWEKHNSSRGESRKTSSRSAAPSAPLVSLSKHLECTREGGGDIPTPWEDGISKKARLCHLSQNPPKTSPLWGVGPIII